MIQKYIYNFLVNLKIGQSHLQILYKRRKLSDTDDEIVNFKKCVQKGMVDQCSIV